MDTIAARSNLLVDLRDAGQTFIEDTRSADNYANNNFRICELTAIDAGEHAVITGLSEVDEFVKADRERHFDVPVFKWNGSVKNAVISKTENRFINTSECFPPALTLLALDYTAKGYGNGE